MMYRMMPMKRYTPEMNPDGVLSPAASLGCNWPIRDYCMPITLKASPKAQSLSSYSFNYSQYRTRRGGDRERSAATRVIIMYTCARWKDLGDRRLYMLSANGVEKTLPRES